MSERAANWEERLRGYMAQNGLRLTQQRRLIADAFFRHGGHPSFEQVYARVRKRDPSIGQATVYRTLRLLVDSGLANSSRFGGAAARYEAAAQDDHHDHLICTDCGRIVEFCNDTIEALQEQVAERHGFVIRHHTMELYGLCADCR